MNEKYTYGYGLGWNVENEYISDSKYIMEAYDIQTKKLDDIQTSRARIENQLNKTLSEDEIRETYDEYYGNSSLMSYESFKGRVLEEEESRKILYRRQLERNSEEYDANLYYLIKIKEESRKDLYSRRRELEQLLREKELLLSSINLESERTPIQYDENRIIINSDERALLRNRYDETFLDIRKIRHALEMLDVMAFTLEYTLEEQQLQLRGLNNPRVREIYDSLDKSLLDREKNKEKVKTRGNDIDPVVDPIDPVVDPIDPVVDPVVDPVDPVIDPVDPVIDPVDPEIDSTIDFDLEELKIKISEYEEELEKYKKVLEEYNQELVKLYELQQLYENDEIDYEEYQKQAMYVVYMYRQVLSAYEKIVALKTEIESYISTKRDQLLQELSKLESEYEEEYHFRAHQQNGMEQNDDDLEKLNKKIKLIKGKLSELDNIPKLEDPIKPQEPHIIPEKVKGVEQEKYFNLEELLYRIRGDYEYKKFDSFIYTNKDIKCFNWNKKRERTFLDKPIKLVKAGIGSIILGGSKLLAKAGYTRKAVRERIEFCINNVNQLSDEEVDYLIKHLSATKMHELQNILPDVVWKVLQQRIMKRVHFKFNLGNTQLYTLYLKIVNLYKEAINIQKELNNEELSNERRKELELRLREISNELCECIRTYDKVYVETDNLLNASGLHGMEENYRARRTINVGGRNSKRFDSSMGAASVGIIGSQIRKAIENGDGISAAKYFIYDEQIKIEHTENKRTLKNRFGKASVGIFQYSPLVKQADYSDDDYLRDVLQTIVIAASIMNMVQQINLKNQLIQANQQIQMQNVQIAQLNQEINTLKTMFAEYNSDPKAFLEMYHTTLKNSLGGLQGTSEYLGLMAQAGDKTSNLISSGAEYLKFDEYTHNMFGDLDRQLDAIFNNPAISYSDKVSQMGKVYEQGVNEIARQAIAHSGNIQAHLAKFGQNYDFTSIASVLSTANSVDPSIISNVFNEYVQAAMFVNNMQALSYIQTLPINVDLTAATVTLAGIVGQTALDEYRNSKNNNKDKVDYDQQMQTEMQEEILNVEIDHHEVAKEKYRAAKEEWDSKGPFYRLFHRKEKPKEIIDFDLEELKERGLSL